MHRLLNDTTPQSTAALGILNMQLYVVRSAHQDGLREAATVISSAQEGLDDPIAQVCPERREPAVLYLETGGPPQTGSHDADVTL